MISKKCCHAQNRAVIFSFSTKKQSQKQNPMTKIISIQEFLSPALPQVFGCKDYSEEEQLLKRVDLILIRSGIEHLFLEMSMEAFEANAQKMEAEGEKALTGSAAIERYQRHSRWALRCTVLKGLIQVEGYRAMSASLAKCPLYRWFCGLPDFEVVRVPGKSTLHGYAHWLPVEKMDALLRALTTAVGDEAQARIIGLENELDRGVIWVDSTCLKANIHFPVDWVLLRDGVRTLTASIATIRSHGLVYRIEEPEIFLRQINSLCMAMTAGGGKKGGGKKNRKKERKAIFRKMKTLCGVVLKHALRYRGMLDDCWEQTDLTRPEAEVILKRMDNVIAQLPEAQRQAHERVIGERQVPSNEKILSLYEQNVHVVVRGKAGAAVEFGNTLFLGETAEGFILDCELLKDVSPGDSKLMQQRYETIKEKCGGNLCGMVSDRGGESEANRRLLEAEGVFNGLCPRNPKELEDRIKNDEVFSAALRRRAQTEGRVAILKNLFLGGTPRAKGFKNRQLQVAWAVLAHNLWVVARLRWVKEKKAVAQAA